jgi:hypothetical protein
MPVKNPSRTTITLEIERGKIVKATGTHGEARKVSLKEVEKLVLNGKEKNQPSARLRAAATAESAPCFAYISVGGKWVKVPVPCP